MSDIVKIEAGGIVADVDKGVTEDVRFATAMARLSDETVPESEKLVWFTRALEILFCGNTYAIQSELAKANGGRLTEDVFSSFFNEVMEQLASKN